MSVKRQGSVLISAWFLLDHRGALTEIGGKTELYCVASYFYALGLVRNHPNTRSGSQHSDKPYMANLT